MYYKVVSKRLLSLMVLLASTVSLAQFWESTGGPERNDFHRMCVAANGDVFVLSSVVHRSTDHGDHWTLVQKPTKSTLTPFPQMASSRSGILYLLSTTALLRSSDNGDTWTQLRSTDASSIAVSPSGMVVIANHDSIMVSLDEGETWIDSRIPYGSSGVRVDMDDIIYISDAHYLYRSKTQGRTWSSVLDGLSYNYFPKQIVSVKHGTAVGAIENYIYSSSDSGRIWTSGHRSPAAIQSISVGGEDSLYLLTVGYRMELSTDGGTTWKHYGRSIPDSSSPYTMSIQVKNGYMYALFENEIYRTLLDTTTPWTRLVVPNASVFSVVPTSDGAIHTLTTRNANTALERSKFWAHTSTANWQPEFFTDFTKINTFSADSSRRLFWMLNRTFIRSDDAKTWAEGVTFSNGSNFQFAHSKDYSYLIADQGGIFRTGDAGVNWDDANNGINDLRLFSVAATEGMIYTGGLAKFYRSSNSGLTWEEPVFPFITGSGNVRSIAALDSQVVVAIDVTGIYFSSDQGTLWRNRSQGLPSGENVTQVLITPSGAVLATTKTGIFQFSRERETWSDVTREIKADILSIALGFDGKLYVGTDGDGMYRSTKTYGIGGTGSVHEYVKELDDVVVYPSPASDNITISFSNGRPSYSKVSIANLLGEVVLTSNVTDDIDVSDLRAGQYFLRIDADGMLRILPLAIVK